MSQKISKTITYLSIIVVVIGAIFLANGLILAWSPPTLPPTGGNVPAPLNVGPTDQGKIGNLGIGTAGPAYKLDVINDARVDRLLLGVQHAAGIMPADTGVPNLHLDAADGTTGAVYLNWYKGFGGNSLIVGDGAGSAVMVVQSGGNVGIGTTDPQTALDVDGKIKTTGVLEAAGISGGAWDQIVNYYACNDPDGGLGYTVESTVTKAENQASDYCTGGIIWNEYNYNGLGTIYWQVREYYCDGTDDIANVAVNCFAVMGSDHRYACYQNVCQVTCENTPCQTYCHGLGWDRGWCFSGACQCKDMP